MIRRSLILLTYVVSLVKPSQYVSTKKSGHAGEKKQFVNQGMFGGYGGGFDAGGGGGFGGFGGGQLELNENTMGGLNMGGGQMEGAINSMFGGQQYGGGNEMMSELGGMNSLQQFGQGGGYGGNGGGEQTLGFGQEQPNGRGESLFGNLNDDNDGDSLYGMNSLEGNYENNLNLASENLANSNGVGQMDLSSFDGLTDNNKYGGHTPHHKNNHKIGDDRQGIGESNADSLSNELGQLDSSDEKLQKMLESGLSTDIDDNTNSAENAISALLNPLSSDSSDAQPSTSADELPAMFQTAGQHQTSAATSSPDPSQQQLPADLNMPGVIPPVTIHAHATDKTDKTPSSAPAFEENRQTALQVQETASRAHKIKLKKLKERLNTIKQKLELLEAEQAKKSTSNKNNDPKTARNDAVKKLLIKNLKLAAMIAAKEIQLEETKTKGIAYLTGKKEQETELSATGHETSKFELSAPKEKPLTELSKKAEEEVNHLSRNPDLDKQHKDNSTATVDSSNSFLRKINETLQVLDHTSPEVHTRSILSNTSRRFLDKLHKQILSMSPDKAQNLEEKALSTLFKAIKSNHKSETKK